jgi:predicted enzyme related to lactoylglutathione lyase
MKITTFNPMIVTKNAEDVIKLFEDLGFEKRHAPTVDIGSAMATSTRMKNADGFCVDVADVETVPQDFAMIRMNVDDFDEAYELLTARGFTIVQGGKVTDSGSSKSAMMVSPSGFSIVIAEHIKK